MGRHLRAEPETSQQTRGVAPSHARGPLRAGNDDRQQVVDQLQAHFVAGRLQTTELESRLEQALAAQTLGDLDALLADLPPLSTHQEDRLLRDDARRGHRDPKACGEQSFRGHATSYLLVMALLVGIWLVTMPGGYIWPIWPMMGWGIGVASHGLAARRQQAGFSTL